MAGKYDHIKELIRLGKRAEARAELSAMVRADPTDADAWYGLSLVVDEPEKKEYCLGRARALRPTAPFVAARPDQPPVARPATPSSPAPKKQNRLTLWLLAAVAVACLVCIGYSMIAAGVRDTENKISTAIFKNVTDVPGAAGDSPRFGSHSVVYRISGSGSAMVSYYNAQGGMEQGVYKLPFRKAYTMSDSGFASIGAQNQGSGNITCIIELDGREWKRSTSSGQYTIVTCAGFIGLKQ